MARLFFGSGDEVGLVELRRAMRRKLREGAAAESLVDGEVRTAARAATPRERAERLYRAGRVAEELVPDFGAALALYRRAAAERSSEAFARGLELARWLGRADVVAELCEGWLLHDPARRDELGPLAAQCAEAAAEEAQLAEAQRWEELFALHEIRASLGGPVEQAARARLYAHAWQARSRAHASHFLARALAAGQRDLPAVLELGRRLLEGDERSRFAAAALASAADEDERALAAALANEPRSTPPVIPLEETRAQHERTLESDPSNLAAAEALIPLYGPNETAQLAKVLSVQLAHTREPGLRQLRLAQLAVLHGEKLGDRGAAFHWRLQAFEEQPSGARIELERLAAATHEWRALAGAYRRAAARVPPPLSAELSDDAFAALLIAYRERPDAALGAELEREAGDDRRRWEAVVREHQRRAERLERDDPRSAADAWLKVVRLYHEQLGSVDEAIQLLRVVLARDPDHLGALDALASLLQIKGAWGEMIDVMRHRAAVEREPQLRAALFLSVADLLEVQEGDLAGAIEAYRAALEADPRSAQALYSLETLYRRCELWRELIEVLDARVQASVDADQQLEWLLEIAQLFEEKLGDAEQAADAYRGALELEPGCWPALRALERLLHAGGDLDGAIEMLDRQLALIPEDADAIYARMEALYREAGAWEPLLEILGEHARLVADPARRRELRQTMAEICERELHDAARAEVLRRGP